MLKQELTTSEEEIVTEEGDFDLGVTTNLAASSFTLKGILPALLALQNGEITKIEPIDNEGLRFHIQMNGDQNLPPQIQTLRKLLEKAITAPINILWTSTYIDFIPL